MAELTKIELIHDDLPLELVLELGAESQEYLFSFSYNESAKFYTLVIRDILTNNILYSTVLRYLRDMLNFFYQVKDKLIPVNLDELDSIEEIRLNENNLNQTGVYIL